MNTGKIYYDTDGNEKTIHQMVRDEPAWAANRIQEGEKAIEKLAAAEKVINDFRTAFIAEDIMELNNAFVDSSEYVGQTKQTQDKT